MTTLLCYGFYAKLNLITVLVPGNNSQNLHSMSFQAQSERIASGQSGCQLLVQLIDLSLRSSSESEFLVAALGLINQQVKSTGSVVVQGRRAS